MKVVSITSMVPYDAVPHAGGRYVASLYGALRDGEVSLTVLSHDSPSSQQARRSEGAPSNLVLIGDGPRSAWSGLPLAVCRAIRSRMGAASHVVPDFELGAELFFHPRMRQALREADLIDIQWEISGRLLPIIRAVARRTPTVVTFHDVDSQRWQRKAAAASGLKRVLLRGAVRHMRRAERRIGRLADRCAVLNGKDAALLKEVGVDPNKIVVVNPVIDMRRARDRSAPEPGLVLLVSYLARYENVEGALWFLREVWPLVRRRRPEAVFRLVGGGAPAELREAVRDVPGVEATGYVEDLQEQYARAAVCVVPLFKGAGVKFKTLEALMAGVPVVTTAVGAEGIGGPELFAGLTSDPQVFADAVCEALSEVVGADDGSAPPDAPVRRRTAEAAKTLTATYSPEAFRSTLARLYGLEGAGACVAPGEGGREEGDQ